MAKWKLDTGAIIDGNIYGTVNFDVEHIYSLAYLINREVKGDFKNKYLSYAPDQQVGKESDFTILFKDGKTIKAALIKEPKDLMEYWEQNKVKLFNVYHGGDCYNLCHDSYKFIASLPSSWTLDRQIDALNKLIKIYKD